MSASSVLTFPEIAVRLGCTTTEAKSAYKNGMRKIRKTQLDAARSLAQKVEEFRSFTSDPYRIIT